MKTISFGFFDEWFKSNIHLIKTVICFQSGVLDKTREYGLL